MKKWMLYVGAAVLVLALIGQCAGGGEEGNDDGENGESNKLELPEKVFETKMHWDGDWANATKLKEFILHKDGTFDITVNLPDNGGCGDATNTGQWKLLSRFNRDVEDELSDRWVKAMKNFIGQYRFEQNDDDMWKNNKHYILELTFDSQGKSRYKEVIKDRMIIDSNITNNWAFDCATGLLRDDYPWIIRTSNRYPVLLAYSERAESNKKYVEDIQIDAYIHHLYFGGVSTRQWNYKFWSVTNLD